MAKVTGKVTSELTYKGKLYNVDDEVTMDAAHAARYEKLNYVKFNREDHKKVEEVAEKIATKSDAGGAKLKPPATK
jgi:hypothetical protein